jgi:hypothetical protein
MRRGLIRWDADELPLAVLQERMQRLRQSTSDADCDAIILYTNFIRCAAVAWLTGFSPYWADGILVVPREGEALFATTLSRRMGMWIQTVMPNASVVTSPSAGQLAGKKLSEAGARRIGILELGDLPAGLYADLAAALPQGEFVETSGAFAKARSPADQVERKLLERADEIAQTALRSVDGNVSTAGEAVAAVERSARLDGAEEVYVALAADLDSSRSFLRVSGEKPLGLRFAVRATVAYKGSWVRRIRTASRDSHDHLAIRRTDAWFAELIATIAPGDLSKVVARQVTALPNGTLDQWFAEGPVGTRPLAVLESREGTEKSAAPAAVLTVHATVAGMPWCGAGLIAAP